MNHSVAWICSTALLRQSSANFHLEINVMIYTHSFPFPMTCVSRLHINSALLKQTNNQKNHLKISLKNCIKLKDYTREGKPEKEQHKRHLGQKVIKPKKHWNMSASQPNIPPNEHGTNEFKTVPTFVSFFFFCSKSYTFFFFWKGTAILHFLKTIKR